MLIIIGMHGNITAGKQRFFAPSYFDCLAFIFVLPSSGKENRCIQAFMIIVMTGIDVNLSPVTSCPLLLLATFCNSPSPYPHIAITTTNNVVRSCSQCFSSHSYQLCFSLSASTTHILGSQLGLPQHLLLLMQDRDIDSPMFYFYEAEYKLSMCSISPVRFFFSECNYLTSIYNAVQFTCLAEH